MRLIPMLVTGAAVLLLGSCATTEIDIDALEQSIAAGVKEQSDIEVDVRCPDQVEVEKGSSFECDVTDPEGVTRTAKVTMLDDDGQVDWKIE